MNMSLRRLGPFHSVAHLPNGLDVLGHLSDQRDVRICVVLRSTQTCCALLAPGFTRVSLRLTNRKWGMNDISDLGLAAYNIMVILRQMDWVKMYENTSTPYTSILQGLREINASGRDRVWDISEDYSGSVLERRCEQCDVVRNQFSGLYRSTH